MKKLTKNMFERLKEELAAKGKLRFRVVTGSMVPLISIGEMIEVAPLRGDIRPFDILVFRNADRLICHYVLHANVLKDADPIFVTRGLAASDEDLPIPRSAVLGRVASHRIPSSAKLTAVANRVLRRTRSS